MQHTRLPCPSPTPGAYSNSRPSSWWCHPTSHPLLSPSLPTFNLPQHQGLFHWVNSSHQVAKLLVIQLLDWFHTNTCKRKFSKKCFGPGIGLEPTVKDTLKSHVPCKKKKKIHWIQELPSMFIKMPHSHLAVYCDWHCIFMTFLLFYLYRNFGHDIAGFMLRSMSLPCSSW